MLTLVFQADIPPHAVHGVKETIEMALEPYGDVKLVRVDDDESKPGEQMKMGGI